jgi:hypothetical protein
MTERAIRLCRMMAPNASFFLSSHGGTSVLSDNVLHKLDVRYIMKVPGSVVIRLVPILHPQNVTPSHRRKYVDGDLLAYGSEDK